MLGALEQMRNSLPSFLAAIAGLPCSAQALMEPRPSRPQRCGLLPHFWGGLLLQSSKQCSAGNETHGTDVKACSTISYL